MSAKINLYEYEVYKTSWYNFTVAEQRIVGMVLTFEQQEIHFSGFDIILCSKQTFVMVSFEIFAWLILNASAYF